MCHSKYLRIFLNAKNYVIMCVCVLWCVHVQICVWTFSILNVLFFFDRSSFLFRREGVVLDLSLQYFIPAFFHCSILDQNHAELASYSRANPMVRVIYSLLFLCCTYQQAMAAILLSARHKHASHFAKWCTTRSGIITSSMKEAEKGVLDTTFMQVQYRKVCEKWTNVGL